MRYAPLQAKCEKDLARAGGFLGVTFCWVCAAGFLQPLPLKYSVANHRPHLGHFWYTVDNFFLYRIFPFSNPLNLRSAKMCDRILVILLKMQPNQPSREYAAPFSGTFH